MFGQERYGLFQYLPDNRTALACLKRIALEKSERFIQPLFLVLNAHLRKLRVKAQPKHQTIYEKNVLIVSQ